MRGTSFGYFFLAGLTCHSQKEAIRKPSASSQSLYTISNFYYNAINQFTSRQNALAPHTINQFISKFRPESWQCSIIKILTIMILSNSVNQAKDFDQLSKWVQLQLILKVNYLNQKTKTDPNLKRTQTWSIPAGKGCAIKVGISSINLSGFPECKILVKPPISLLGPPLCFLYQ